MVSSLEGRRTVTGGSLEGRRTATGGALGRGQSLEGRRTATGGAEDSDWNDRCPSGQPEEIPCFRYPDCLSQLQVGRSAYDEATPIFP